MSGLDSGVDLPRFDGTKDLTPAPLAKSHSKLAKAAKKLSRLSGSIKSDAIDLPRSDQPEPKVVPAKRANIPPNEQQLPSPKIPKKSDFVTELNEMLAKRSSKNEALTTSKDAARPGPIPVKKESIPPQKEVPKPLRPARPSPAIVQALGKESNVQIQKSGRPLPIHPIRGKVMAGEHKINPHVQMLNIVKHMRYLPEAKLLKLKNLKDKMQEFQGKLTLAENSKDKNSIERFKTLMNGLKKEENVLLTEKVGNEEFRIMDADDLLYSYFFIPGANSQVLFENIFLAISENLEKLATIKPSDDESKALNYKTLHLLDFCNNWVTSDLYPNDLIQKEVKEALVNIYKLILTSENPMVKDSPLLEKTMGYAKELTTTVKYTEKALEISKKTPTMNPKEVPNPSDPKNINLFVQEFDRLFRNLYAKIQINEFSKGGAKNKELAPNFYKFVQISNNTTGYVKNAILLQDINETSSAADKKKALNKAVKNLENFIEIADQLRLKGNLEAANAIFGAIDSVPMERLIPHLSKKSREKLNDLKTTFTLTRANFRKIEETLVEKGIAYVPCILKHTAEFEGGKSVEMKSRDRSNTAQLSILANKIFKELARVSHTLKKNPTPPLETNLSDTLLLIKTDEEADKLLYKYRDLLVPNK